MEMQSTWKRQTGLHYVSWLTAGIGQDIDPFHKWYHKSLDTTYTSLPNI